LPEVGLDDCVEVVDVLDVLEELEPEPLPASETVISAEPELPKPSVETI
jgi:hypothetical protein